MLEGSLKAEPEARVLMPVTDEEMLLGETREGQRKQDPVCQVQSQGDLGCQLYQRLSLIPRQGRAFASQHMSVLSCQLLWMCGGATGLGRIQGNLGELLKGSNHGRRIP